MQGGAAPPERLAREVCVLGTRRDEFVEFRFSIGSPDLAVDLIMPLPAFRQFCLREDAHIVMADAGAEAAFRALEQRGH